MSILLIPLRLRDTLCWASGKLAVGIWGNAVNSSSGARGVGAILLRELFGGECSNGGKGSLTFSYSMTCSLMSLTASWYMLVRSIISSRLILVDVCPFSSVRFLDRVVVEAGCN